MPEKDIYHGIPFNNNDLALTHRQKSLHGSYGIQHHIPRDLEAVSPNRQDHNRHKELFPAVDTSSGLWTLQSILAMV